MAFGNLTAVEVRGHIGRDSANPASGWVDFIYRKPLRDDSGNTVVAPQAFRATLDADGEFSITIPANDDPNGSPQGYKVLVEVHTDQWDDKFECDIPYDTPGWLDFESLSEIPPFSNAVQTHSLLGHIHLAMPVRELPSPSPNIVTDASRGTHFRLTLTENAVLLKPENARDGQRILWEVIQDSGGGNTISLGAGVVLGVTIASLTLSTVGNKRDFIGGIYNAEEDLCYIIALAKGY